MSMSAIEALKKADGNKSAAARLMGIHRTSFRDRLLTEQRTAAKRATFDALPDEGEPVDTIIDRRCKAFERHKARVEAERWLPITVNETGAFGLMVLGDEHADDNHCDWPQLHRDLKLARDTPGVYACAVGDIANNWVGRLMREYAEQAVTRKEARQLLRWLLSPEAAPWLFRLIGNHDFWNEGDVLIGLFGGDTHYIADWEAKIEIRAGAFSKRIHASHNFKGTSIYNKTHGPLRAAMFSGGDADLYLAGHLHTFGTQSFEIEETGKLVHVARARGYKRPGRYEKMGGYPGGEVGSALFVLFNPDADTPAGQITIFNDVVFGCKVLSKLRGDTGTPRTRRKGRGQKARVKEHGTDDRTLRAGRRGKKHSRPNPAKATRRRR